ncbi:unnamed protein product [Dibothriocephalus latus]|uniref:Uncharacterized protein n=1 Tax=Dibothriocephalus latus TaxID=60516 RepID=A0A3P7P7I2_DIBLA|nr:unnamed protein product [Dibothriocephalus latus]
MIIACQNGECADIEVLLLEFKQATCTYSHYTQVCRRSAIPKSRPENNTQTNDVLSEPTVPAGRGLFQTLSEGAGRAISGLWAAGEQLFEDSFEGSGDGLMKQTYSSVVQLTQEYFNAMLITHRSWLTLALEPRTDTTLLAAARSLGTEEAFCKIFSEEHNKKGMILESTRRSCLGWPLPLVDLQRALCPAWGQAPTLGADWRRLASAVATLPVSDGQCLITECLVRVHL